MTVKTTAKVSKWQALETEAKKLIEKPLLIIKGAEDIGEKTILVIEEVRILTPEFKTELGTLISDITPLAQKLQPVLASDGSNIGADIDALKAAIPDIKKLVKDFLSFVPVIDGALKTLESDVEDTPVTAQQTAADVASGKTVAITFDDPVPIPMADFAGPSTAVHQSESD